MSLQHINTGTVPLDWIRQHRLLPFFKQKGRHLIAISQYSDLSKLKPLTLLTGDYFHPVLCDQQALQVTIQRFLQLKKPDTTLSTAKNAVSEHIHQLISHAIEQRASDIHFEPYEKDYRIRLRIDGQLLHTHSPPHKFSKQIISHIKILAHLDITETRLPQDGRFKLDIAGRGDTHFRLSFCPTLFGEKLVIRILGGAGLQPNLNKLGLLPEALTQTSPTMENPVQETLKNTGV